MPKNPMDYLRTVVYKFCCKDTNLPFWKRPMSIMRNIKMKKSHTKHNMRMNTRTLSNPTKLNTERKTRTTFRRSSVRK